MLHAFSLAQSEMLIAKIVCITKTINLLTIPKFKVAFIRTETKFSTIIRLMQCHFPNSYSCQMSFKMGTCRQICFMVKALES